MSKVILMTRAETNGGFATTAQYVRDLFDAGVAMQFAAFESVGYGIECYVAVNTNSEQATGFVLVGESLDAIARGSDVVEIERVIATHALELMLKDLKEESEYIDDDKGIPDRLESEMSKWDAINKDAELDETEAQVERDQRLHRGLFAGDDDADFDQRLTGAGE